MPPKQWRNMKSVLSKRRENVDGLTCQVWTLFQDLDNMRVYVPDFNLFHGNTRPDLFFKKVRQEGVFLWRDEPIATSLQEDYNNQTSSFEEAMLKLIGIGLDCVKCGHNGQVYHRSTETYETISKSFD